MADYEDRPGVPQRTGVMMDIRSNLGGSASGYTGRDGVPQDVDVLMDIRELTEGGGTGGGGSATPASVKAALRDVTWQEL